MSDPYTPVIPGTQRQAPSARTFNGLLRAGQANSRNQGKLDTGPGGAFGEPSLTCLIQNKTGADLPAFSVLVQAAALVNPATVPFEAQAQPAFTGVAVSVITAPFVITTGPLGNNAIGQAVVSGLALVDVNITSLTHTRAVPTAAVTNQLASAASGGVVLWWTPGATGVQKCLVLVGSQSDGPDATPTVRGWVSTGTQSFGGNKTFTGSVLADSLGAVHGVGGDTVNAVHSVSGETGSFTKSCTVWNLVIAGGVTSTRITSLVSSNFIDLNGLAAPIQIASYTGYVLLGLSGSYPFINITDGTTLLSGYTGNLAPGQTGVFQSGILVAVI